MYLVKLFDGAEDKQGTVIHSPYINDLKLSSGVVKQVLNAVNDFTFSINLNNPGWGNIKPLRTLTKVIDVRTNQTIFNGRVLKPKGTMSENGHFNKSFICESILGYLQDSSQRHAEIHDTTIREFLKIIIDNHNKQVEPHKQFKVGNVTVTNTTDNVYRYLGYESSFDSIKDKLIDRLGGYIVVREESDGNYIDYLAELGEDIDTKPIRLAHNMKNMSFQIDPTKVITRLVPLGKSIESEDEESTDASQARLTIDSVNNGMDYIDDLELQAEFGVIEKSMTWDDITTPQRLLSTGRQFLQNQKAASVSYSVNSANTELIGIDIQSFEVGNRYPLINPILSVNEKIQVIEKQIDLLNPQKSALKIGDKHRTLTQYQNELRRSQRDVIDLQNKVSTHSQKISNLATELNDVDDAVKNITQVLEENDIPALEQAVQDLQEAIHNLNQAIENIPDYDLVTNTTNGLMASVDKVKLDLISISNQIDIDELYSKFDKITVTQSVDLDDLVSRVNALEHPSK